jgi:hypothetical protein
VLALGAWSLLLDVRGRKPVLLLSTAATFMSPVAFAALPDR